MKITAKLGTFSQFVDLLACFLVFMTICIKRSYKTFVVNSKTMFWKPVKNFYSIGSLLIANTSLIFSS